MSVYDNYQLTVNDNILEFTYSNNKILDIGYNSNVSYNPLYAPEYNFLNSNYGISFNSNNNFITFKSLGNIFENDIYITGKINASQFPSNLVILDENNKIDSSYLPTVNTNFFYNSNAIGIGVSVPLAKLHIRDGDAFIQNGRIGVGAIPAYNCHIYKNDAMISLPAFVVANKNKHIIDIYTEKELVIINDDGESYNSNINLNVCGLTATKALSISNNFFADNTKTMINNDLYVNNISSVNNSIIINSNIDLVVNNTSIGSIISNIKEINDCFDIVNKKIVFSSNINFDINLNTNQIAINNNSNQIIIDDSNLITNNLITSNIKLINYDSLTSNPNLESVFDIKGKIRLYNDSPCYVKSIFVNDLQLFLITSNNKLIAYNLNTKNFLTISNNFNYSIFKAKYQTYGFYNNTLLTIYYNNYTYTINNIIIRDFAFNNLSSIIYYINQDYKIVSYNLITLASTINNNLNNIIKIDTYNDTTYVVLTAQNLLYHFNGTTFTQITFNNSSSLIIKDFSTGNNHTLILTDNGVWSCGYINVNNLTFKKGYTIEASSPTIALKIAQLNTTADFQIITVKANNNSSIVIDNNGSIHIFGTINKLFNTTIIAKIDNFVKNVDFCCNNTGTFILTYFNDIITIGDNNTTSILLLTDEFYGTSIKSRGSIVIGGNNFNKQIPKNSLLVENFVGIGTDPINTSNYSLVVSGNINIINGSIYNNGILFNQSSLLNNDTTNQSSSTWIKNNNEIYYNIGNVGIGLANPRTRLHVKGTATFDDDVYINGSLITNEYKPWTINSQRNIYYDGIIGLNTKNPEATLHLYEGTMKATNLILTSNYQYLNTFTSNIANSTLNTSYINPILISGDGTTIVNSFYIIQNSYNNNNNSNVEIYKYFNNKWNIYRINDITNGDTAFGEAIAISKTGNNIYVGAYTEKNINSSFVTITGGIYKYSFDINNNLIKNPTREIAFNNANNDYYQIGRNINCSSDGNILISTINNYTDIIYIKNLQTNTTRFLDFNKYSHFHSSFSTTYTITNSLSYNNITIDTNENGTIIVLNFIYNFSSVSINNFVYYNFYIIKDYEVYLLKFYNNNHTFINSYITSVSITDDASKIFITTSSGYHYIYDFDFTKDAYLTTTINNSTVIFYYDKTPSFYFYKKDGIGSSLYRGKIAKSGNTLIINNNINSFIYKCNKFNNTWSEQPILSNINTIDKINNYSISLDYEGRNCAISYLRKLQDLSTLDTIEISNSYTTFLIEKNTFHLTDSNLNVNIDAYFTSNVISSYYYGDGSNITNITMDNIINNNSKGIVYTSNNKIYNSDNLYWLNTSNCLVVNDNIDTSNIYSKSIYLNNSNINDIFVSQNHIISVNRGGTGLNILNSNRFLIGNGTSPAIMTNNLIWNNNRLIFQSNATLIITSNPPIINIPFISNSHFAETININNGGTGQTSFSENGIVYFSSNRLLNSPSFSWCNIT
jgi:hypothetical protein